MGKKLKTKSLSAKQVVSDQLPESTKIRHSPLGWIVLFGPLSIVMFLLIFGDSIPWLLEQSSVGAKNEAEEGNSYGVEKMKAGQYREAFAHFSSALEIKPDYADPHVNIGKIYYQMGDFDHAVEWLNKAIALDPPQKDLIYNNLGMMYAKKGDLMTALEMFERAQAAGMKSRQIYKNIGTAHMKSKYYPGAIEAYKMAIEHQPTIKSMYEEMLKQTVVDFYDNDDEESIETANSAEAHLKRGVTDEELVVYDSVSVNRFIRNTPHLAEDYYNLARAQELNNDFIDAIRNYLKVLNINPSDPQTYLRLGILHLNKGDLAEAKEYLEHALSLDRNLESAKRALKAVMERIESGTTM